jgi:putative restriction endonuclease
MARNGLTLTPFASAIPEAPSAVQPTLRLLLSWVRDLAAAGLVDVEAGGGHEMRTLHLIVPDAPNMVVVYNDVNRPHAYLEIYREGFLHNAPVSFGLLQDFLGRRLDQRGEVLSDVDENLLRMLTAAYEELAQKSVPVSSALPPELERRQELWSTITRDGAPAQCSPKQLRELGIFGAAQGIWVDKAYTSRLTTDGEGIAVSILLTGAKYADDLSDDGVLYHYPDTARTAGSHDRSEIAAMKRASDLSLPIFVIVKHGAKAVMREVHLAWIESWDDASKLFLITFTDSAPAGLASEDTSDLDFTLLSEDADVRKRHVVARPNQQRFKFEVLARYGLACAVCDINAPEVLDAIHLAEKAKRGVDHAENGLILCATHHRAFDAKLFGIDPSSRKVQLRAGAGDLRLTRASIDHLRAWPHPDALAWRWAQWLES